jgi:acetyl-CoA carboxylase/biotin carboxylase 1
MEAKGCAKPTVWKEARRHFYWATRARLAQSNALGLLTAASPSQSREYLKQLLNDLSGVDEKSDHRAAAEALEDLDLSSTIAQLKGEHIAQQLLGDRKSLIGGFVRLADCLSEDEKATMLAALKNTTNTSPGPSDSCTLFIIFSLTVALYYRTTIV